MTNAELADIAAAHATAEPSRPGGTLARRANLCAAVALRSTTTITKARAVLETCPPDVRVAALACLDELERNARHAADAKAALGESLRRPA